MLGSISQSRSWRWTISGKHPSAPDYFKLGHVFPTASAFSEWIDRGYTGLRTGKTASAHLLSWRFWLGGMGGDSVICGIVRDSSDSIGRLFPLLILGMGPLSQWERHWDYMPYACEKCWSRMEHISTRMFRDVGQIEDELGRMTPPEADWRDFMSAGQEEAERDPVPEDLTSGEDEIVAPLAEEPFGVSFSLIRWWHTALKERLPDIPKAVFMGGDQTKAYLVFFRRALAARDFIKLWSVGRDRDDVM